MTLSARSAGDLKRRQIHYFKWKRLRDQIFFSVLTDFVQKLILSEWQLASIAGQIYVMEKLKDCKWFVFKHGFSYQVAMSYI